MNQVNPHLAVVQEAHMGSKNSVVIILALVVLIGGVIYLSQAVEPPRDTAVDVLENERFAQ